MSLFLKHLQKCWGQSHHSIKIHSIKPVVSQESKFSEDVDSVLNFVGLSQYAFLFLIAVEQFQVTVGCSRSCDIFFLHIE